MFLDVERRSCPTGEFSNFRNALLAFYPEDLRLKKISFCCARAAQAGQYNLRRSLKRHDLLSAFQALMLYNEAIHKRYRPFYKWLYRALKELPQGGKLIHERMEKAVFLFPDPACCDEAEIIAQIIVDLMRMQHLTDEESEYLLPHALSVKGRVRNPVLRSLPLLAE